MLLAFILLYLLLNLGIGFWAWRRVRNAEDYALAGRRLPLILAATATFATWFGSETVLGASGEFLEHGLLGVIEDPLGAALCLLLVGLFFARPLFRLNILTFCDYFRIRYNGRAEFVSALFMVPSYFGWVAAQLVAMGLILQTLTGMELVTAVILSTTVVVAYTALGGMWAVSVTDFVQTILILLGLAVLAVDLGMKAGWEGIAQVTPQGFWRAVPGEGTLTWPAYFAAWMTIGLGSIPQQDVFQRVMSGKTERVAVRASFTASGMYLVVAALPLFTALAGASLYPELRCPPGAEDCAQEQFLLRVVMTHAAPWLQALFFGALLSAIMSTASGAMLAPATVLAENLVRPLLRRNAERSLLGIMRLAVVAVAGVSAVMALSGEGIYELVGESSELSLVSLFVPLAAGLYWRRASAGGAMLSMLAGMALWLPGKWELLPGPALLWGLGAAISGMVAGSFIWRNPEPVQAA